MKNVFIEAFNFYAEEMEKKVPNFWASEGYEHRIKQCNQVINSLNNKFNFDKLITIETGSSADYGDGLFGILLGYVTKKTNGKMYSVDISSSVVENSKKIFNEVLPDLDYECVIEDSVTYLKNFKETPNLVHLDSWDFDLFNPFPSALHGWREFEAIESKMPSGGIIIIDDNWCKGTYLQWVFDNGVIDGMGIKYPMIGKGTHVYQYVKDYLSDWELIGTHYEEKNNMKIVIQKK